MTEEVFARGVAAHGVGALDQAERSYRDVLSDDPGHTDALTNLGRLARGRGDFAEAIFLY